MRLERLIEAVASRPLVRVYGFTPAEVAHLFAAVSDLAAGRATPVAVHDLPGVEPVENCRLTLRQGNRDRGLIKQADPASFDCILTAGGWDNVSGLLEPFLVPAATGYQWLTTSGDASWLISRDGQW